MILKIEVEDNKAAIVFDVNGIAAKCDFIMEIDDDKDARYSLTSGQWLSDSDAGKEHVLEALGDIESAVQALMYAVAY